MLTTTLRTVGGSVMFAIPKSLLEGLGLKPNQEVGVSITDGRLMVDPTLKPRYLLADLVAQCDLERTFSADEREWMDDPAVGREVI